MSKRKKRYSKGYSESGASYQKRALKAMVPNSGAPSEDIDFNNPTLRQRSRMLYMSSPVATSAINTNRTKVVGTGLELSPAIDIDILKMTPEKAREWQTRTKAEFNLWASKKGRCDALGLNNFASLQQLVLSSWLLSGDCFTLIQHERPTTLSPYGLRLHVIEADRVGIPDGTQSFGSLHPVDGKLKSGNMCYDGVEVNAQGKVLAYHIRSDYPNQNLLTDETTVWTRVPAIGERTHLPNILHIMSSERPDQYRGVPYLAQVIEPMLQIRRYTESELMAALVQSFFTAWITTESDPTELPMNEVGGGDTFGAPGEPEVSHSENEYEMAPGTVTHLANGEKIQFGNPNIPTNGFDAFLKAIGKEIGAALEIPYDILMKEFNSSYSASRGALLEAWEAFRMRRTWFVDDFCQPVYEIWLSEAIARGRISAPGFWDDPLIHDAWCKANWIGPVQGQLDPTKEINANILAVEQGFKTHEQVTREMGGGDWERNVERLKLENEKLQDAQPVVAEPVQNKPEEKDEPEEDRQEEKDEEETDKSDQTDV